MEFEEYTVEQYRSLDMTGLEARRALVHDLCIADDCDVDAGVLRKEAEMIADEFTRRNAANQLRSMNAAAVAAGHGTVVVSGHQAVQSRADLAVRSDEDPTSTIEYRTAFMDYVCRGIKSDVLREVRENQNTLTTDVSAVIPTVLVNKIIEKAESYGMILPLVTKTNYPAGVEIPVATLKPVATWVNEGATSDRQKLGANQKISFTHHKLRCEVSISMEVGTMALSAFESKIVEIIAKAIVVAKEKAIIGGTGSGQPKGILKETPADGQAIKIAKDAGLTYETLVAAEAAIPEEYESGAKWFMSKRSFMAFVGITDKNGQPIARVNYGIGGKPERTLLGREVITTGSYLPDFDKSPDADVTFAFIFDMSDYVMNSVYDMGISKKQDWDTEDLLTKAVTACDGKVTDKNSLVTLTVSNASI